MAFFDWNHDGKKNYIDNAIEMMIIDDIEAEEANKKKDTSHEKYTPEWGVGYSGKKAYRMGHQENEQRDEEMFRMLATVGKIFVIILAAIVFIVNVLSIFVGYVSWLGLIVSAVILAATISSTVKKRSKINKK